MLCGGEVLDGEAERFENGELRRGKAAALFTREHVAQLGSDVLGTEMHFAGREKEVAGLVERRLPPIDEKRCGRHGLGVELARGWYAVPYVDKSIEFKYFFTRKVCLVKYSCAFIVMPGGLGTLDELFEAATLIQCQKIGPFPLILMGAKFWEGMRQWGQSMMKEGVVARDEIGFGSVTDPPREAVDLIVRSLPRAVKARLKSTSVRD